VLGSSGARYCSKFTTCAGGTGGKGLVRLGIRLGIRLGMVGEVAGPEARLGIRLGMVGKVAGPEVRL
jgi:hypothetical protein